MVLRCFIHVQDESSIQLHIQRLQLNGNLRFRFRFEFYCHGRDHSTGFSGQTLAVIAPLSLAFTPLTNPQRFVFIVFDLVGGCYTSFSADC